ncbi:MAG: hypothetical protein J6X78_09595 [Treponema sp.]|nr:hypothetical protein [Treponema sp.]
MTKRIQIFLIMFIITSCLCAETKTLESKKTDFDLADFYANPFKNRETIPLWFDDYTQLKTYFVKYVIEEENIPNKYTKGIDKEITIKNNNEIFLYYLRSYDGRIFKKQTYISNLENIKKDFNDNMNLSDIINICGDKYIITDMKKNADVHYNLEEGGTVHFLIDKETEKLECIVLSAER